MSQKFYFMSKHGRPAISKSPIFHLKSTGCNTCVTKCIAASAATTLRTTPLTTTAPAATAQLVIKEHLL